MTEERTIPAFPQDIRSLTTLRYFAAIWVIFFHFRAFFPASGIESWAMLLYGLLGVDFFFVLSGFILAHVYLDKFTSGRLDYWSFIVRRVGRIYPMHVFTLLLMIGLGILAAKADLQFHPWDPSLWMQRAGGEIIRALFAQLTMIHAWGATAGLLFNLPSWSISAEWFAYLLFPVFLILLVRKRASPLLILVICISILLAMDLANQVFFGRTLMKTTWNLGVLRIAPEFALGIALYRYGRRFTFGPLGSKVAFLCGIGTILALTALTAPHVAIVIGLAFIVFAAADAERYRQFAVLKHPFGVLLGEISYSVYMLHFPAGVLLFHALPGVRATNSPVLAMASILMATIGITVLSWISYRLIEVPGRRLLIAAGKGAAPRLAGLA